MDYFQPSKKKYNFFIEGFPKSQFVEQSLSSPPYLQFLTITKLPECSAIIYNLSIENAFVVIGKNTR